MKILHVCETMRGGVGTYQNEIVPLQQEELGASQIAVLVPREDLAQIPAIARESVHAFDRPSRIIGFFRLARAFFRLARRFRPDVVHVHSTCAGFVVRPLAAFLRLPVVYCPHGWAMERYKLSFARRGVGFIEKMLSFLCARIVAVSEAEALCGIEYGIASRKMEVILNGLKPQPPVHDLSVWTDERVKLLFVGRLDRQKGIDILLRAIHGLQDRVSLRVVGDAVAEKEARVPVSADHVSFLGWKSLSGVASQMESCDVLVAPSRWEGLPLVVLEAMRLAKPVIGADVGGMSEAIVNGQTGFLFEAEDVDALRALLASLDKTTLKKMGDAARERFLSRFTAEKTHNVLMRLYGDIVRA